MTEKTKRELLFSVTRDDCEWSTMTASGPGGQHRNRVQTAVRCVHRASGAVGQASDDRSQLTNRRHAFERMAASEKFKSWHRMEVARRTGQLKAIERKIDDMMDDKYLRIDYYTPE